MTHELIMLAPVSSDPKTLLKVDDKIAYLIMHGVDFPFSADYTLPATLPDDWRDARCLYLFLEEYEQRRPLLAEFPGVDEAVRLRRESSFSYPPLDIRHPNGRCLLCLRSMDQAQRSMDDMFWRAQLTMNSPALARNLLAVPDGRVVERFLRHLDPTRAGRYENWGARFLADLWHTEQSYLMRMFLLDWAAIRGDERCRQIALASVDDYLQRLDPADPLFCGDHWSNCGALVAAYQSTGDQRYLDEAKRHIDLLFQNYTPWNGCFGLWANDQWLRDSTLCAMGVPRAQIARHYDEPMRSRLYDGVAEQYLATVRYLRDQATGLYRFGARTDEQIPTLHGHGSQWQAMAFSLILGHVPQDHAAYAPMAQAFREFMAAVVRYQDADGFWHTFLDQPDDGPGDMLYTPALTGALYRGLALRVLDASFEPHARKGFDACKRRSWDGCVIGRSLSCSCARDSLYYWLRPMEIRLAAGATYMLFAILEKARFEHAASPTAR